MKVFLTKGQIGGEQYLCLLEKSSALAPFSPSPILRFSYCDISSEPHSLVAIFFSACFALPCLSLTLKHTQMWLCF